jgi:hypothetical protein
LALQLDTTGIYAALRAAGLLTVGQEHITLVDFNTSREAALLWMLSTIAVPSEFASDHAVGKQLLGLLVPTEWHLRTFLSTDGVAVVVGKERKRSQVEIDNEVRASWAFETRIFDTQNVYFL